MSYKNNNQSKIARPASATNEFCQGLEAKLVAHYEKILTPALLIANRKGCYATVINSTISTIPLVDTVGSDICKVLTETVLNKITASISTIS